MSVISPGTMLSGGNTGITFGFLSPWPLLFQPLFPGWDGETRRAVIFMRVCSGWFSSTMYVFYSNSSCTLITTRIQSTFCVNSLAHWLGETPFDDKHTPRDHLVTALVTIGEGYHNFHHQFPMDYRNAIKWYQYDPTKWFISACKMLGLASHLKVFLFFHLSLIPVLTELCRCSPTTKSKRVSSPCSSNVCGKPRRGSSGRQTATTSLSLAGKAVRSLTRLVVY
jgi:hypothetical protein